MDVILCTLCLFFFSSACLYLANLIKAKYLLNISGLLERPGAPARLYWFFVLFFLAPALMQWMWQSLKVKWWSLRNGLMQICPGMHSLLRMILVHWATLIITN